jgi:DNA-directed RNA polymerase specialized sigma24 family protein
MALMRQHGHTVPSIQRHQRARDQHHRSHRLEAPGVSSEDERFEALAAPGGELGPVLEPIYRREYGDLVHRAAAELGTSDGAEDVVQASVLALLERWRRIRSPELAIPWLHQAIVHRARSITRRREMEERAVQMITPPEPAPPGLRVITDATRAGAAAVPD